MLKPIKKFFKKLICKLNSYDADVLSMNEEFPITSLDKPDEIPSPEEPIEKKELFLVPVPGPEEPIEKKELFLVPVPVPDEPVVEETVPSPEEPISEDSVVPFIDDSVEVPIVPPIEEPTEL